MSVGVQCVCVYCEVQLFHLEEGLGPSLIKTSISALTCPDLNSLFGFICSYYYCHYAQLFLINWYRVHIKSNVFYASGTLSFIYLSFWVLPWMNRPRKHELYLRQKLMDSLLSVVLLFAGTLCFLPRGARNISSHHLTWWKGNDQSWSLIWEVHWSHHTFVEHPLWRAWKEHIFLCMDPT